MPPVTNPDDPRTAELKHAEGVLARNLGRQVRLNRLLHDELPGLEGLAEKLQRITDTVVEAFDADFCRIWVTTPGDRCDSGCVHARVTEGPHVCRQRDRCLHLLASAGRYTHLDGDVHRRVPFGCYKIGRVAAAQDPKFLTNDVQHDPRVHNHDWASELGLVSFAGYRLCATDGTPIGVLALFAKHAVSPDEDSLLEGIAASTSHIIQTLRAEDELRRARDGLEVRVRERTAELAAINQQLQTEIAERARAEQSLRESEATYRHLFDGLNDAVFLADAETGRILETNRRGEELLGKPRDAIVGMHQRDLHPAGRAAEYEAKFGAHAAQGRLADYDGELARADGTAVPVRISATPLSLHGRSVLLGLFHDITERKRADEIALRFSRQQNVVDALLRIGWEDAPLDAVLERCLREVLFNPWLELAPQGAIFLVEDAPQVLVLRAHVGLEEVSTEACTRVPFGHCLCGRAAATGRTVFCGHPDARHVIACESGHAPGHCCVPLRSMEELLGVLAVTTDAEHGQSVAEGDYLETVAATISGIIQRKRMEQRLRESEARHRTITEAAQDAIVTADANGCIRFWNPAAEKIFGFKATEMVGRSMLDLIVPARFRETKRQGLVEFARTGQGAAVGQTLELSALRKDGTEFPIQISVSGYRDHEGYVAVALVKDITDRKRAEADLEATNRELQDASRRVGMADIAAGVLHSVGNALNSANVSTQLVTDRVRQLRVSGVAKAATLLETHSADLAGFLAADEHGRQLPNYLAQLAELLTHDQATLLEELQSLAQSIEHIKSIVSMQQAYARMGGIIESFSLQGVIDDALRMSTSSFKRHDIEIVQEVAPDLPPLTGDRQRILQILINLVRNAKHALRDSAVPIDHKRITVRVGRCNDDRVAITVIDNGPGIRPENMPRLFSLGFTTKKNGHGFGLHSSALAAKQLGGALTAYSAGPGQGATFVLDIPVQPAEATA